MILVLFTLTGIIDAQAQNENGWQWQNPQPLGDPITQVQFIDSLTGWMVPENTTLLKTTDGGASWNTIYTNIYFDKIYFIDKNEGWGVGRTHFVPEIPNSVYNTTDGGMSWELQLADTLSNDVSNMFFLNKNYGWIGGTSALYITKDGGKDWNILKLDDFPIVRDVYGSVFIDTLRGWAFGDSPYGLKTTDGGKSWSRDSALAGVRAFFVYDSLNLWAYNWGWRVIKSTNGGDSWQTVWNDAIGERNTHLCIQNPNSIYLSTTDGFYETTNGGKTWNKNSNQALNGFSVINGNEVWGGGTTASLSCGIFHSTDSGHHWDSLVATNNPLGFASYQDVDFTDNNTGWIITQNSSRILKTTSGGETWFEQNAPTQEWLRDITMLDRNTGYITGGNGTILKTTDGGENWIAQNSGTNYDLGRVCFVNKINGWIVGQTDSNFSGIILKTTNGGMNWINQTPGSIPRLYGVSFVDSLNGWAVSGGGTGYDYGVVLRTKDGGVSWFEQTWGGQYYFTDVFFIDTLKGFVLGKKFGAGFSIYRTIDGGETWQPTAFYESSLSRIKFVDKNTGWVIGAYGDIYNTSNGGDSWTEQHSYTHQDLYGVDFTDANNGWAVGWYGTILHTSNGGVTFVDNKNNRLIPKDYTLFQNYPNPFNPSTIIQYNLSQESFVTLKVYDILGREVANLVRGVKGPGYHNANFNGRNLSSGVYIYRLSVKALDGSREYTAAKKLLLMK